MIAGALSVCWCVHAKHLLVCRSVFRRSWGSTQQAEQAQQADARQEAGGRGCGATVGVAMGLLAFCVRLQAGGVGHDVRHVVLLFDPVEEVSHWAFGVDGDVLAAVRFSIQWDGGLLHVLLVVLGLMVFNNREEKKVI